MNNAIIIEPEYYKLFFHLPLNFEIKLDVIIYFISY